MKLHEKIIDEFASRLLMIILGLLFIITGIINPDWAMRHMSKSLDEALKGN